jgi:Ca2+-binding RTX toxin-like protein
MADIPVYIIAGQSNALGFGLDSALNDRFAAQQGAYEIVKLAQTGTSLEQRSGTDWSPRSDGELYDQLLDAVRATMRHIVEQGHQPVIADMFWIQGEADAATAESARAYGGQLIAFVNQLRADLKSEFPFIVSQLSESSRFAYADIVRAQQERVAAALDGVTLVDTSDLSFMDGAHYTYLARQTLAGRLFHARERIEQPIIDGYVSQSAAIRATGSDFADVIDYRGALHFQDNIIHGLGGDDRIYGGHGQNILYGDAGDDVITSFLGDDIIYGGAGNDVINASDGWKQLGSVANRARWNVDNDYIVGGDGDDVIYDMVGNNTILGGRGNDRIYAGMGNDTIYAGEGDDFVSGLAGNDRIAGLAGADRIRAGQGDDYVDGGEGDDAIDGDEGNDILIAGAGNNVLHGGDGLDRLFGGRDRDTLYGDAGDDLIAGGEGADWLYGGAGNDRISGGAGRDVINGGAGDDVIAGSSGDDVLRGGLGRDIFLFQGADGIDVIADFVPGEDQLRFSGMLVNGKPIDDVQDVLALVRHNAAGDVVIAGGGFAITLTGVHELHAQDLSVLFQL